MKAILTLLKKESIDEIVNVCDAAREGELIFWEIIEHAATEVDCTRMWLQSMTASAIQKAYDERRPAAEYSGLRDAAVVRAEADWLIGMSGSRAITIRLPNERDRSPYSVGRVQTPTLAILVDRELSRNLVLEMDQVFHLSGRLLRQIQLLEEYLNWQGGELRLSGLSDECYAAVRKVKLEARFPRFHTRQQALSSHYPGNPR